MPERTALFALIPLLAIAGNGGAPRAESAEVFVLANDGQIQGELVNADESPREKYVIRTSSGATVTLDRSQVKQVVPQRPAETEYEKIRPTFADTAEAQWQLAEWCREHDLVIPRREALERVIELDSNHKAARMALRYRQIEGRWVKPEELRQEQGYVRHQGKWLTPQEVEILQRREKTESSQRNWRRELGRMRGALNDPAGAEKAADAIRQIRDPLAVEALVNAFESEPVRAVRLLYVQALGGIASTGAVDVLVAHSLSDRDEEVRLTCLDQFIARPNARATSKYVEALRSKDNVRVNRAAYALGKLQDKSAVPALINALITTHKVKVVSGGPNSISAGFGGPGGGGLSVGSSSQVQSQVRNNQHVLDALVALSGGMNYQFNKSAWKNWYAAQSKPVHLDVRRD